MITLFWKTISAHISFSVTGLLLFGQRKNWRIFTIFSAFPALRFLVGLHGSVLVHISRGLQLRHLSVVHRTGGGLHFVSVRQRHVGLTKYGQTCGNIAPFIASNSKFTVSYLKRWSLTACWTCWARSGPYRRNTQRAASARRLETCRRCATNSPGSLAGPTTVACPM